MNALFEVQAVMRLMDMITGPLRGIQTAMAATQTATASLSTRLGTLASAMAPAALASGLVVAGLGSAVATAADFEAAISGVGAVARAAPAEMNALRQAALDLGASTAWSASQVAEGQKYLAMAGFTTSQNIAALPGVLNLASAGATDLGRAADISSDILSGFGLQATEMGRVADVLTQTFTTANVTLEGLGETMKYVAPVASKAGVSLEGAAAMAGLLGNVGIKGSQAGTTLRAMLNRLSAPASNAASELRALGVTVRDEVTGNLRSPIAVLGEMATALEGKGTADQLKLLKTVFGEEAMTGVAELIGKEGAGGITKYLETIRNATGAATDVAGRQLDNLKGDVTLLGSAWEGLNITVGSIFTPALRTVAQGVTTVVGLFDAAAQHPLGGFLLKIAGFASTAILGVTGLAVAGWGLSAASAALIPQLAAMGASLLAVMIPIWPLIAVAGVLAAAWKFNLGGFGDTVSGFFGKVRLVFQGVREILGSLSGSVGMLSAEMAAKLEGAGLLGIVKTISRVFFRLGNLVGGFAEIVGLAGDVLATHFSPVFAALVAALEPLASLFGLLASALFGATAATPAGPWLTLGRVVGTVLLLALEAVAFVLKSVLVPVLEFVGGLLHMIGSAVVSTGTALGEMAGKIHEVFNFDLAASGRKMISTVTDGIRSVASEPMEAVKGVFEKVRNLLPFSDAREGPLSDLTLSGSRILETLGVGIQAAAPGLHAALAGVLAAAPLSLSPEATQFTVPAQTVVASSPAAPVGTSSTPTGSGPSSKGGVTIHIHNLSLPSVGNGQDFVAELQRLVEGYYG